MVLNKHCQRMCAWWAMYKKTTITRRKNERSEKRKRHAECERKESERELCSKFVFLLATKSQTTQTDRLSLRPQYEFVFCMAPHTGEKNVEQLNYVLSHYFICFCVVQAIHFAAILFFFAHFFTYSFTHSFCRCCSPKSFLFCRLDKKSDSLEKSKMKMESPLKWYQRVSNKWQLWLLWKKIFIRSTNPKPHDTKHR